MILFDFAAEPTLGARWNAVDDRVMGGKSQSAMSPGTDCAIYAGTVSLENSGGFASARSPAVTFDLAAYDGLRLSLRGDGKRYGAILRSKHAMGVRYQIAFTAPPGDWSEVYLPFSRFDPKVFGMGLPLAPPLNLRHITSVGLIIAEKQAGPFRLEIAQIAVYQDRDRS